MKSDKQSTIQHLLRAAEITGDSERREKYLDQADVLLREELSAEALETAKQIGLLKVVTIQNPQTIATLGGSLDKTAPRGIIKLEHIGVPPAMRVSRSKRMGASLTAGLLCAFFVPPLRGWGLPPFTPAPREPFSPLRRKTEVIMNREFLKNFQVNGQALPKEIIDAIMAENGRDIEAAKADPGVSGAGGKTFTQEDVNRIVSERLARDRADREAPSPADEREQALKAREARLDCRDFLDSKKGLLTNNDFDWTGAHTHDSFSQKDSTTSQLTGKVYFMDLIGDLPFFHVALG